MKRDELSLLNPGLNMEGHVDDVQTCDHGEDEEHGQELQRLWEALLPARRGEIFRHRITGRDGQGLPATRPTR